MRHVWYRSGDALLQEIASQTGPSNRLSVWSLGQCGFLFGYAGVRILIDPMLNDLCDADGRSLRLYASPFDTAMPAVDLVICTHGHCDHMAIPTLTALMQANPRLRVMLPVGCVRLARENGIPGDSLIPMTDEASHVFRGVTIRTFSTAHPTHIDAADDPDMALGCCITFGSMNVVHLGDTYLTPRLLASLRGLGRIGLLMMPVNGRDLFREACDIVGNLSCEEAARLAAELKADVSIPMHYDMISGNTSDPLIFVRTLLDLRPEACFRLPALGEQMLFRC